MGSAKERAANNYRTSVTSRLLARLPYHLATNSVSRVSSLTTILLCRRVLHVTGGLSPTPTQRIPPVETSTGPLSVFKIVRWLVVRTTIKSLVGTNSDFPCLDISYKEQAQTEYNVKRYPILLHTCPYHFPEM